MTNITESVQPEAVIQYVTNFSLTSFLTSVMEFVTQNPVVISSLLLFALMLTLIVWIYRLITKMVYLGGIVVVHALIFLLFRKYAQENDQNTLSYYVVMMCIALHLTLILRTFFPFAFRATQQSIPVMPKPSSFQLARARFVSEEPHEVDIQEEEQVVLAAVRHSSSVPNFVLNKTQNNNYVNQTYYYGDCHTITVVSLVLNVVLSLLLVWLYNKASVPVIIPCNETAIILKFLQPPNVTEWTTTYDHGLLFADDPIDYFMKSLENSTWMENTFSTFSSFMVRMGLSASGENATTLE
jgi:hypothetical protein